MKKKIIGKMSSDSEYYGNHDTIDPQNAPPNMLALQHSNIFEAVDMGALSPEGSPGRKEVDVEDSKKKTKKSAGQKIKDALKR